MSELNKEILSKAATQARGLAIDAVHACQSGHLGLPLGCAEIGAVLERHLVAIGLMEGQKLDEEQRLYLAEKRAAYEASQGITTAEPGEGFPPGAQLCGKCNTQAVVQMDGCATCLNCGYSKCG